MIDGQLTITNDGQGYRLSENETSNSIVAELSRLNSEVYALQDSNSNNQALYALVCELINRLSRTIAEAEQAGISKSSILEAIKDARMVFGRSQYVGRMQEWPRGYQGDFETVEMIYQGAPDRALNTVANCVEYYAQMLPISQQHRNKLTTQQQLAMEAMRCDKNILSIGCGGAIDISNALEFFPDYSGRICFVDMDKDAMALTQHRTSKFDCTYSTRNVVRGINNEQDNSFSLVLCGGLFDYLDERTSTLLLKQIDKKLTRPGKLFLTNIALGNPFRIQMEYLGDWTLIERTEQEVEDLINIGFQSQPGITCQRDATGLAILATAVV